MCPDGRRRLLNRKPAQAETLEAVTGKKGSALISDITADTLTKALERLE